MERMVNAEMKFGRSCTRCKVYFVTDHEANYLCPWCQRVAAGKMNEEVYVTDDLIEL
jgi:predicted RNA-binding Zn-ribbon protein involved in translation (DUF1610 family)